MPFVNKEIRITDFLEWLRKKIESQDNPNIRIFFKSFLQKELVEAIKKHPGVTPDWDGRVNAGDFDVIYPLAADILYNAASANFSEVHPDTYTCAHAVSTVFCEELNEIFQCSGEEKFDLIPIKSFVDMTVEAGMVKIKNGMVIPTFEGEKAAQNIKRKIEG